MELDMVSDKVAGHRCWFMGPNFFGPNLSQLAHLLSFASLFQTYYEIFSVLLFYPLCFFFPTLVVIGRPCCPPSPSPLFFIPAPEKWLYLWKVDIIAICCLSPSLCFSVTAKWWDYGCDIEPIECPVVDTVTKKKPPRQAGSRFDYCGWHQKNKRGKPLKRTF